MMLVGDDPLLGRNGSSPCSGQPSALLFPQHVTRSKNKRRWYNRHSGLNCLLFSVETSFLVVTGWNEFCGRFGSFWWLDNYIGDSLHVWAVMCQGQLRWWWGVLNLLKEKKICKFNFGDRDQLLCAPRRTLCSQYSNNAEEETINIV